MISKPINKILIIRLSSLGDILLTTPVIKAIKQNFPDAEIDFVLRKEYADVLLYNDRISHLFYYVNDTVSELKKELQGKQFDIVIDLQNNLRSSTLIKGLHSIIRIFKKPSLKKLLLVWFKINLLKESKTIVQRYAEAAEIRIESEELEIIIPPDVKPVLDEKTKYAGFCPGSRHYTKRWLPEYFVELGKKLQQEGFTVVLFGGKSDKEICRTISEQIPGAINLQNDDHLLQTAAEMKRCRFIVTNDSGLMHTAAAVNTPMSAIFGSTVKEFGFMPSDTGNVILENKSVSCRPCSHIGKSACPKKHFKCMKDITPEEVLKNLKTFAVWI